ncbi:MULTISPECIES: hypothetical protein [Bacillus cereus group]|uniref:Uncharacterized protein n=1 Tax=Bacillus thuringiensis serovar mexicanensis TaxID=180868 RepID=A0A242W9Z1_BACTU|nr:MULTISPECIES: hypothetical protein [Bacillus cereus group]MEB9673235.1 hypothetical protein [Bacillus anthracis]OTW50786.1 hypothetical protein BK699_09550 [Bacillus thuringiensis serovar mexicanensis]OTX09471.1 hypothetical protein BK705_04595 [Bacillus thuringiensis serovar monterrey]
MLNRSKLREHALKNNLSTIATRLIAPLAMVTDIDGRIYVDKEDIRKQELMSTRCIPTAFKDLEEANCIYKEDGVYYNNMAIHIDHRPTRFTYISLYKFFQDKHFKKLYKRPLQFLYYILTSQLPGEWHRFAIERGYVTATNNPILKYFYNFKDLLNVLVLLIENGLIEIEFTHDGKKHLLTSDIENVRELLEVYCELNELNRKKRTCDEKKSHVIRVRIAKKHVKRENVTSIYEPERLATLRDLRDIAIRYGHDLEQFEQSSLEKIHMTKKKLYDNFGKYGVQLYRDSLQRFFQEQSFIFPRLMREGKFGNYILNFYVMPVIRMTLSQKLEKMKVDYLQSMDILSLVEESEPYINFITTAGIDDEVINIASEISTYTEITATISKSKAWDIYFSRLNTIYDENIQKGLKQDYIHQLAKEYKLSNPNFEREFEQKLPRRNLKTEKNKKVATTSIHPDNKKTIDVKAMFNSIVKN